MLQKLIAVNQLEYSNDKYNQSKSENLLKLQRQSTLYQSILQSVKEVGLKNPLIVHPENKKNKYKIYIGNNRLTATKDTGLTHVQCIVGTFSKQQVNNYKKQYKTISYSY